MIMPTVLFLTTINRWPSILKFLSPILIIGVAAASLYAAFNDYNHTLNNILSNRPIIWNTYGDMIERRPLFGHAGIDRSIGASVAEEVTVIVRRGMNVGYGTQNLFIRYAYEDGLWAPFAIAFILALLAWRNPVYRPSIIAFLPVCASESLKIGMLSIWGVPLLIIILLASKARASTRA
ncbi:hypothetical protein [Glycocaulis sp.]|uniref:hypothetical protein n=1 Tax=Glycocaulis sp. TaxID=1969725 RepID=UPI003F726E56